MKRVTMILGLLLVIMAIWAGTVPNVMASDEIVGGCIWCEESYSDGMYMIAGCSGDIPECEKVDYNTGDASDCTDYLHPCSGDPGWHCDVLEGEICGC